MVEKKALTKQLMRRSQTGICFPSAGIYLNQRRLFTPASNTKLYTSWFACKSLGEDASFHSEYSTVDGTLYFRPLGNPLLDESNLAGMIEHCEGMRIKEIVIETGHIRAARYPGVWNFGDRGQPWGAPVSDVCFHENCLSAKFDGGDVPPDGTSPASSIHSFSFSSSVSEPHIGERKIVLPSGFKGKFSFAILEPEDFILHWISDHLTEAAEGRKLRTGRFRGEPVTVAECGMPEVLRRLNKQSSNIIAELLLLHAAGPSGRDASTSEAASLMRISLEAAGINDAWLFDGSGLCRGNLVSPAGTVKLLRMISGFPSIRASLPVGGVDGTLRERKLSRKVSAKTGSLGGVQALSGYAENDPFSIIVNHFPGWEGADGAVKEWIDERIMSVIR